MCPLADGIPHLPPTPTTHTPPRDTAAPRTPTRSTYTCSVKCTLCLLVLCDVARQTPRKRCHTNAINGHSTRTHAIHGTTPLHLHVHPLHTSVRVGGSPATRRGAPLRPPFVRHTNHIAPPYARTRLLPPTTITANHVYIPYLQHASTSSAAAAVVATLQAAMCVHTTTLAPSTAAA